MNAKIYLPIRSFSINSMHYATKRIKTSDARHWENSIFHYLNKSSNQEALKKLREAFDKRKHGWEVSITFIYPDAELYTKTGELSSKVHDLSNVEKPIIDLVFLPKYHKLDPPYGCPNLDCDDRYIKRLHSEKVVGAEAAIELNIGIVPK